MNQETLSRHLVSSFAGAQFVDVHSLDRLRCSLRDAACHLDELDATGRWWGLGSYAAVRELSFDDLRFGFCARLPSSMALGKCLVDALAPAESLSLDGSGADAAGLLYLLVTAFDGVCDETPELLEAVLPALRAAVEELPAATDLGNIGDHPINTYIAAVATAFFAILAARLALAPRQTRDRVIDAVRQAFRAQLDTLGRHRDMSPDTVLRIRSEVSVGITRLAAQLALLFYPDAVVSAKQADRFAGHLGHHFAWIDDLADLEGDLQHRYPNSVAVAAGLRTTGDLDRFELVDDRLLRIDNETHRRWNRVVQAVKEVGLPPSSTLATVATVTLGWFGLDGAELALAGRHRISEPH
jgi:hypothetical protein